jgi:hypothetical protein
MVYRLRNDELKGEPVRRFGTRVIRIVFTDIFTMADSLASGLVVCRRSHTGARAAAVDPDDVDDVAAIAMSKLRIFKQPART